MKAAIETYAFMPVHKSETVIPDPGRLIFALRQIGYSLEQALSDLIDNAIAAGASNILIRFLWSGERILSLAVADDGHGMSDAELRNAMRFGSMERLDAVSLGKFGLGLKLSSFSHARQLTVVSVANRIAGGRRWTLDGIRRNWDCAILSDDQAAEIAGSPFSPIDLSSSGTIVLWEDLDKLPVSKRGLRYTLRALHRRLELHLGLHFHRFLQSGNLNIYVDQQELGRREQGIRAEIAPLDPFGYPESPSPDFPTTFRIDLPEIGTLDALAHIWPPNSILPEYKLGNRAAARQGFWFYRNNRLIQAGGWNGFVQHDSEPHSSLARVCIDLPSDFDASFSLNVQKSSVIVPPGFIEAVQAAITSDGATFDIYRQQAQSIYRDKDRKALSARPVMPGLGLPTAIAQAFKPGQNQSTSPTDDSDVDTCQRIDFKWTALSDDEFFRVDSDKGCLLLNRTYRDKVLAGLRPTTDDVPLIKTLLLCLVSDDLRTPTLTDKRRREHARLNRILVAAASLGMG
ncbi:MAG: ATP-binding protein [Lamprobacter sp.]|uniref:ATP-binding protein n=1 Tax=Lamprobacter sp. TaxID=3100796 RepID=UPI002B262057|nr:ATP-binding protein [Lamprobacter sp.]MEA3640228.1 ATP-binding protein [Lamprobacter sp.]